jgi:hypothetical protein
LRSKTILSSQFNPEEGPESCFREASLAGPPTSSWFGPAPEGPAHKTPRPASLLSVRGHVDAVVHRAVSRCWLSHYREECFPPGTTL